MAKPDNPWDKVYEALGRPDPWPHPHWFRCPGCKGLGTIDADQYAGRVSIVCTCGWHDYRR